MMRTLDMRIFLLPLVLLLAACATGDFKPGKVAKTDVDLVADTALRTQEALLRDLTLKLYRRNPRELKKAPGKTLEGRIAEIFDKPGPLRFEELNGEHDVDAILLGFSDGFRGDRVFAVMAGLTDMLRKSYGYHPEFYLLDDLDGQKLYNSARNIEILVWRLSHKRNAAGELYILTNEGKSEEENLSFERLFGKMIALQDVMAQVQADHTQRTLNHVVQGVASMVFLPI